MECDFFISVMNIMYCFEVVNYFLILRAQDLGAI